MDYIKMLRDGFLSEKEFRPDVESRLEYLSDEIFNFTTYDSEMSELFASKAIEVCKAINERTTFEYIKDPENYKWYLLMCNMPFFANRTEWGTSIRGARWHGSSYSSCGLFNGNEQFTDEINFEADEWQNFVNAIIEFANIGEA